MKIDVVRAWKDAAYRSSLSADEVAFLPSNPAGLVDLTDAELKEASGLTAVAQTTCICCTDTNRPRRCCP
ncbi:MAG: mersacidin/lichenicidin family type 2 lantibiotic [Acidobacteria bacterium]|nr:MAG: mersacidin/lichenicidin family type 2 lantibiotic [Acidobacteriota bacterium]